MIERIESITLILATLCFAAALVFLCGLMWRQATMPLPEPIVIERTDTIYRPPVPEFIEAFRLQCEWVAR